MGDVSYICIGRESEGGGLQIGRDSNPGGSLFPICFTVNCQGPFFSVLGTQNGVILGPKSESMKIASKIVVEKRVEF